MPALPALAEETAGTVNQVSSATQNSQTARGGKNGRTEKAAKQDLFNQLLADGVITQEQYGLLAGGIQVPPVAPET